MLALTLLFAPRVVAQISPGPLSRAHQSLEGARNCITCHGNGKEAMNGQCLACHKELAATLSQGSGFHAAPDTRGQRCASCHPDHAGADLALIQWPGGSRERFPHAQAGWSLQQSHATADCLDCHQAKYQQAGVISQAPRGATPRWVGLTTRCASCHTDVHRGALKDDCTACHDAGKWTITPGFQHDTTGYALTGKHRSVACADCHATPRLATRRDATGQVIPVYRPIPHAGCTACHADPHKGGLGGDCATCHSTTGFKVIDRKQFDHQRTRYPLAGKHATVKCASCHGAFGNEQQKRPPFATCGTCHRDAHRGSATIAGKPVDCASCHTVATFSPASFTPAQHRETRYPLEGRHASTSCGACHTRDSSASGLARWGTARVVIRPAAATCRDCHADDHGSQLLGRDDQGACSSCHTVAGWTPSRFGAREHAALRLPLSGKHATISCSACHAVNRPGLPPIAATASLGKAKLRFRITEVQCADCHQDPHRGRFAVARDSLSAMACSDCHDATAFRPSTLTVDQHRLTGFTLDGAHGATPCVACHKTLANPRRPTTALLRGAIVPVMNLEVARNCADCHRTPHGDQFSTRSDGGRCESCHDAQAFAPASRFDHNRGTTFSLRGAHERVPCRSCHTIERNGDGTPRQRFRPLSAQCESCHAGATRQ